MIRKKGFVYAIYCIAILALLVSKGFAAQELGEEGYFDRLVQHPAFNLWLPSDFDPVGNTLLRPIEEAIPRLDITGLFRTRFQVVLHDHPFDNLAPGQGAGTHPLMFTPPGAGGDRGERIEFRVPVWEQLLELEINYQINNNWRFNLILNQTYNAAYDIDSDVHHFFDHWAHENEWKYYHTGERIIKDCWIEYQSPFGSDLDYSIRIGKQFVTWGRVDGARVMDIINPEDVREGAVQKAGDDWEYFKLGLWMANFYTTWSDYNLQILFIPDFEEGRLPLRNANGGHPWEWQFASEFRNRLRFTGLMIPRAGVYKKPDDLSMDDAEWGVRFGLLKKGWAVHLSYFYTWTDAPYAFIDRYIPLPPIGPLRDGAIAILKPSHTRIHQFGLNFEKMAYFPGWSKGIIVKGEVRYDVNPYFQTADPWVRRGYEKHNVWTIAVPNIAIPIEPMYTLGFRFDTRIVEGHNRYLLDLPLGADAEQVMNAMSLVLTKFAFKSRLFVFNLAVWNIDKNDFHFQSKWQWQFTDKVKGLLELYIYEGQNFVFGQFDRRDNITIGLEYRFD